MTDIVERLKDAETATHALFNYILQDAREEIERLRIENEALRAEIIPIKEVDFLRKVQAVADSWRGKCERLETKIAEMEKQEPFDADSDVFRSAFEAALKAGNWPATRQGDGYRAPSTQIAWRIAFSTVNRLKLYALPGAKGE